MKVPSIAIIGEYSPDYPPHVATTGAIGHSAAKLDVAINSEWLSTDDITDRLFESHSAIWVAPGSPYKNMEKTLSAIRYARENDVPCLGTCGGFQHMIIDYARNVLGFVDAQHAEYDPYASNLFISELKCSLAGRPMTLKIAADSLVSRIYGSLSAIEDYYCNFGVDPSHVPRLKSGPLHFTGSDDEGEVRVLELPNHRFYIGTLFVPQMRSTESNPHPLVTAFLQAVMNFRAEKR